MSRSQDPVVTVFSIRVKWSGSHVPVLNACIPLAGRVNATVFDGREPGTVFYMGPRVSEEEMEIVHTFSHRTIPWNLVLNTSAGEWEPPPPDGASKRLFESADFTPLLEGRITE
jgi:hypothetical protein